MICIRSKAAIKRSMSFITFCGDHAHRPTRRKRKGGEKVLIIAVAEWTYVSGHQSSSSLVAACRAHTRNVCRCGCVRSAIRSWIRLLDAGPSISGDSGGEDVPAKKLLSSRDIEFVQKPAVGGMKDERKGEEKPGIGG